MADSLLLLRWKRLEDGFWSFLERRSVRLVVRSDQVVLGLAGNGLHQPGRTLPTVEPQERSSGVALHVCGSW
jgi:hypothetical protein